MEILDSNETVNHDTIASPVPVSCPEQTEDTDGLRVQSSVSSPEYNNRDHTLVSALIMRLLKKVSKVSKNPSFGDNAVKCLTSVVVPEIDLEQICLKKMGKFARKTKKRLLQIYGNSDKILRAAVDLDETFIKNLICLKFQLAIQKSKKKMSMLKKIGKCVEKAFDNSNMWLI